MELQDLKAEWEKKWKFARAMEVESLNPTIRNGWTTKVIIAERILSELDRLHP